jgi:hypothetical protein
MNRFCQDFELMALGTRALQQVGRRRLAGKQKDLAGWEELPYVNSRFYAIHVGHNDIADHEIRLNRTGSLNGARTGVHGRRIEAVLIQNDCKRVGYNPLIVND